MNVSIVKTIVFLLAALPYLSCKKMVDWNDMANNPAGACDVSEYHLPYYDEYAKPFPFLFKKKYDASGKVKEIDCSFWNVISPNALTHHELVLDFKGSTLYLLKKNALADTVMQVYFDTNGRVKSLVATNELSDFLENARSNNFFYVNNKLAVVETMYTDQFNGNKTNSRDSISYDKYGNILKFGQNSYLYNYAKKVRQQFYIDDLMQHNNGYYLLQYLGYFPEVTSPAHLRTYVKTPVFHNDLTNHVINANDQLTGYETAVGDATITYRCNGANGVKNMAGATTVAVPSLGH